MRVLGAFSTIVLSCWVLPAAAQDPRGKQIIAPAGYLPGTAIYCDDGSNHAVLCSFASGGGGGDPSSTGTVGGATAPATVSMIGGYDGGNVRRLAIDGSGRITAIVATLPAITGAVSLTGSLPGFATAPTVNLGTLNGAATAARQDSLLAALGLPYQAGGALPLPSGAATATAQATTTSAITAAQAVTGTLAATAQTVTTTLPQLTASTGLAISFGATAATLFNANAGRHFIVVQVQGSSGGCYINGLATATADANSLYLPAGGYFESTTHVGTGAISIVCTAASTPVYSRQG